MSKGFRCASRTSLLDVITTVQAAVSSTRGRRQIRFKLFFAYTDEDGAHGM